jgi:hypothetical protein
MVALRGEEVSQDPNCLESQIVRNANVSAEIPHGPFQ